MQEEGEKDLVSQMLEGKNIKKNNIQINIPIQAFIFLAMLLSYLKVIIPSWKNTD